MVKMPRKAYTGGPLNNLNGKAGISDPQNSVPVNAEKTIDMKKEFINIKMDKRFFSVASLSDHLDDKDYWSSMNPIERMRHIEVLRRINYGHGATSRLQRVFEFTEE
jgi:hypothetical protein